MKRLSEDFTLASSGYILTLHWNGSLILFLCF